MIPPNSTVKAQLETLANRLDRQDIATANNLRDLADAVDGGPSCDAWAASNLYQLIDPEAIAARHRNRGNYSAALGRMETARNILVLIPLMLTWIGIALAVAGYRALLAVQPAEMAKPFLYLWQDGFKGYTPVMPWLTLSHIAWADVILLMIVVVLTAIVYWRTSVQNLRREQDAEDLARDMGQALAGASLLLAQQRSQQPVTFLNRFDAMSRQLMLEMGEERRRLEELRTRREKELGDLATFTTSITLCSKELSAAALAVTAANAGLAGSVRQLANPVQQLSNDVQGLSGSAASAANGVNDLLTQQRAIAGALQTLGVGMITTSDTLQAAAGQTVQVANGVGSVASTLAQEQSNFLASLAGERAAQASLAQAMSQAANNVEVATNQIGGFANNTHAVAVDMAELARQLQFLPQYLRTELTSVLKEHQLAAAEIERAGTSLEDTAGAVEQTLRNLLPGLQSLANSAQVLSATVTQLQQQAGGRNTP